LLAIQVVARTEGWVHDGISFAEGNPTLLFVLKSRTSAGFNIHVDALELMSKSAAKSGQVETLTGI